MAEKENSKRLKASGIIELDPVSPDEIRRQVHAIVRSTMFRNAPALQRLLQYVTFKTIEGKQVELKEYTIGVEAFDRGQGYDPKIDTVVRVEMHRLRQKLREYYEAEGVTDPIIIDVPKGHYYTTFKSRISSGPGVQDVTVAGQTQASQAAPASLSSQGSKPDNQSGSARWRPFLSGRIAIGLAATVLLVSGILIGALWVRTELGKSARGSQLRADSLRPGPLALVRDFWASFIGDDTRPVMGFAQAVFLIDKTNDLLRFRRGASDNRGASVDPHLAQEYASNPALVTRAGPLYYESGYTGIGDLEGISMLVRVMTQMGYAVTIKRCRLVSVDDLRSHNVILLGSSFQNDAVAQLPDIGDFVYKSPSLGNELWNGEIVNRRPLAGEAASYRTERDPSTGVVKADYALVTVEPGIVPGRSIANIGALDTSGVMGATQFLTSESGLSELMRHLKSAGVKVEPSRPTYFQALLRVDVENGLDVFGVHLVTVHPIRPGKPGITGAPEQATSKTR